ncbi:Rieske (2Fe-2S) protein [Sphaerisporangium aureirubrum]|uniref:Rieske (2Fe-2S) protein n=1 Tax=Sphaerisporangium aureirubrum TaxID=1544736 RepID=A0ABW1NJH1_9ACTN
MTETETTRRAVMVGAGGAGLAAVLSACSGYGAAPAGNGAATEPAPTGEASPSGGSGAGDSVGGLASTADIPKGGGKIFKAEKIVITQPSDGEFKAFSSICPHMQCPVGSVSGGSIVCHCHNSKFSIADGSVQEGPSKEGLAEKPIKVDGGNIALA